MELSNVHDEALLQSVSKKKTKLHYVQRHHFSLCRVAVYSITSHIGIIEAQIAHKVNNINPTAVELLKGNLLAVVLVWAVSVKVNEWYLISLCLPFIEISFCFWLKKEKKNAHDAKQRFFQFR